jgi:KTSC domain
MNDGREPMPSTAIRDLAYNADTRELNVTFVSGRRYRYADVPPGVFAAFCNAPSRGAFFNHEVRDRYAFDELISRSWPRSGADGDR